RFRARTRCRIAARRCAGCSRGSSRYRARERAKPPQARRGPQVRSAKGGPVMAAAAIATIGADALAGPRFSALPPLSLYVHVPWCLRKCPYCDFNSHEWRSSRHDGATLPSHEAEAAYVAALMADVETALPSVWGRKVSTVFIG